MPKINPSSSRMKRHNNHHSGGTAQLGGILACLDLNSNQLQHQGKEQVYRNEEIGASKGSIKMKTPSGKLPTHLNVPSSTVAFMSPLASPTFRSPAIRAEGNKVLTDSSEGIANSANSRSDTAISESASGSTSSSSRGGTTYSASTGTNTNTNTPLSKSISLGSETLSEATETMKGLGLKASSSMSSDGDYVCEDDNSLDNGAEENYTDEELDDDTYAGASYIVKEEYVPYGRPLENGSDEEYESYSEIKKRSNLNASYISDGTSRGTTCAGNYCSDDDHTYGNASYFVQEKIIPYGIQQGSINNKSNRKYDEEDGYESPMAIDHDEDNSNISTEESFESADNGYEVVQEAIVLEDCPTDSHITEVEVASQNDPPSCDFPTTCNELNKSDSTSINNAVQGSKRSFSSIASPATSMQNLNSSSRRNSYTLPSTTVSTSAIVRKGKWTLGSRIGEGSFGVVHTAMNGLTGKLMAVKTMNISNLSSQSDTLTDDLRREIDLMKSLEHPNIVRYLGCEVDRKNKMFHIFQEWLPGGSIASMLRKFGPFPLAVVKAYLHQILLGLSYLHQKNILHRDIKGGNILVNDDGQVKLADFGTGKRIQVTAHGTAVDADDAQANMTMCGTPFFMAPEVFEESYGRKADVWSCACVVHQMCTSNHPWKGLGIKGPIRLFSYITKTKGPPPLSDDKEGCHAKSIINDGLAGLLEQCFQRDPSKRPSAQTLLHHNFFSDADESMLEDDSVHQNDSIIGRNPSIFSPSSSIQTCNSHRLKNKMKNSEINSIKKECYDTKDWPAWATEKKDGDNQIIAKQSYKCGRFS